MLKDSWYDALDRADRIHTLAYNMQQAPDAPPSDYPAAPAQPPGYTAEEINAIPMSDWGKVRSRFINTRRH